MSTLTDSRKRKERQSQDQDREGKTCFLVLFPQADRPVSVPTGFDHVKINDRAYAVASNGFMTTREVMKAFKIGGDHRRSGMVVRMDSVSAWLDTAIVEKITFWRTS